MDSLALQALIDGLLYGFSFSLIAVGYTLIFGVLRVLNIAHGQIAMAGAFIGLTAMAASGGNMIVGLVAALLAAAIVGVCAERLTLAPMRNPDHLAPVITTIGAAIFILELFNHIFTADARPVPNPLVMSVVQVGPFGLRGSYILIAVVASALMIGLTVFVAKTRFGRAMRTIASNDVVAKLTGVNVPVLLTATFAVASALGGIATLLLAMANGQVAPSISDDITLKGLVVMVLGGIGSVPGAFIAGILLGAVETVSVYYLGANLRDLVAFVALFVVLLIRPGGLLGYVYEAD